jgi:DMSO reductase anchor subunit
VTRVRTSWLSREGVLALLFVPVALGYLVVGYLGGAPGWQTGLGIAGVLLAWATLFSTGMIYACLKTIPQWNDRLVPAAYLVNGHLSGALLLLALAALDQKALSACVGMVLVFLALTALVKGMYYRKFGSRPGTHALPTAIGMTAARAKLLDSGHTHGTFLTHEFVFRLGREQARLLRGLFFALSLLVPTAIVAVGVRDPLALALTALACLTGLLAERWLFFAEAQHVVRLYHGQQTV